MIKIKFNVKKLLSGIAVIAAISNAHAQTIDGGGGGTGTHTIGVTPPSGRTHCTTINNNCNLNGTIETTFTISTGGEALMDATDEFRVVIKLYKGDWTPAGWGFQVTNEVFYSQKISPVSINPSNFSTSSFYSTNPVFTVTKNGSYRAKTTLQQKLISGIWVDRYTTLLSPYYVTIDTPPYTGEGDWAEVALITELNVGNYFNYRINGYNVSSPIPNIITCAAVPLIIHAVAGGADNPGTSTITVQKGSLSSPGNVFTTSGSPQAVTFDATTVDQNLYSLFPTYLNNYAGALKVTYRVPDDVCGSTTTPVSKSMTITVATAAFLNEFKARTGSAVVPSCASAATGKAVSSTWNITSAMPSSAVMNTFRCQLKTAIGWQGANSVGITNLTYTGNYTIDVYEVSPSTGIRLPGAPSLFLKSGISADNDDVPFGDFGYSAGFDALNPPFYVKASQPANALGEGGGYNYFAAFYEAARDNSITVGNLTSFSARVFCVEVNQYPAGGCVVSNKSYFRIANNGLASGSTARMATSGLEETEEEYTSLDIYPNPTKGELIIPVTEDDTNVSIRIMDNLGKEVYTTSDVRSGHINIEKLTAGIYFYTIEKNGNVYRGKIIKE